jgi:hypothetical protein
MLPRVIAAPRRWWPALLVVATVALAGGALASVRDAAAQSGLLPAGSCNPPCLGPKTPQGDPHTLFGGPRSGELAPHPRGYGARSLQAEAHELLLEVFGPQIGTWEYALARRLGAPPHDSLTTRALGHGIADFVLHLRAGSRPIGTARWRVRWWDVPVTPAFLRALAHNDLNVILPPADALARRLESFPPNRTLPRTDTYEIEANNLTPFLDPAANPAAPRRHLLVVPLNPGAFIPEYVVRGVPPDFALLRGQRAMGHPPGTIHSLSLARDVRFYFEYFDGIARDTHRVRISPSHAAKLINGWIATPLLLGWKRSHLHGRLDLRTLMHTPIDTVTLDPANLLGPPN